MENGIDAPFIKEIKKMIDDGDVTLLGGLLAFLSIAVMLGALIGITALVWWLV